MIKRPPHILFLMDDQHRFDVAGFAGNSIVRTPNLDRLAKDACIFNNAYTPSPICVPGRQCIMSGQLPTTNGCLEYGDDLEPFSNTFARQLSEEGYETVCAGKLHHMGLDQMQGWTQRIGWDMEISPDRYAPKAKDKVTKYNYLSPPPWSLDHELNKAGPGTNHFALKDEYATIGAEQFIEEYFCGTNYDRNKGQPILLKASYLLPHYPFICSEDKFEYYINRIKPYDNDAIIDHFFAKDWTYDRPVSKRNQLRAIASYYAMVEETDERFGRIITALENAGQDLDDWIIIYTTDHGEMLGEHNTWWKLKFYEGSVKVPLFIRSPNRFSHQGKIEQTVSLCDLYASICNWAGAQIPADRDSRDLSPLLNGQFEEWNNEAISIYQNHIMVKKDSFKYWGLNHYEREVLFNLTTDPNETKDLSKSNEHQEQLKQLRSIAQNHLAINL